MTRIRTYEVTKHNIIGTSVSPSTTTAQNIGLIFSAYDILPPYST